MEQSEPVLVAFFKVLLTINDKMSAVGFIVPNKNNVRPISMIEEQTGLRFLPLLRGLEVEELADLSDESSVLSQKGGWQTSQMRGLSFP